MNNRFLLGLIGIPSAGKTTFARELAKMFEEDGYPTIIIDNKTLITGFKEEKIREALEI